MNKPEVSIILTFHNEGILAHKTILAILRSAKHLEEKNIKYEVIAHIDNGDKDTIEYFDKFKPCELKIFKNSFGNPADSRNFAISKAKGDFITLIDGDDLISENWLLDGYKILKKQPNIILHPEANMTFGFNEPSPRVWIMKDSFDDDEDTLILFGRNRWCSGTYLSKEIAIKYPYDGAKNGYGYEDWYYNSATRGEGIKHMVIPNSVLFYRIKDSSIYKSHTGEKTVVAYTEQFSTKNMQRIGKKINITEENIIDKKDKNTTNKILSYGYKVCKHLPGIKKITNSAAEKAIQIRSKQRIKLFPEFLLREWKNMNSIDNSLYPDGELIARMPFYNSEHDYLGKIYCKIVAELTKNPDYIFLPPILNIGGTEKVIINYLEAFSKEHPKWHIVVLGKLPKNHRYQIPKNVDFIDFDGITKGLPDYDKDFLFSRLIIQTKVKRLHIINNVFYYRWVQSHQKFIRENNYIINVSHFMNEYTSDENRVISFADPYIREIYPCINKIFTDNKNIIEESTKNNAFSKNKFSVHYQPVNLELNKYNPLKNHEKIKILWASRVSEQKRPDILKKIAKSLSNDKYQIDVYGRMQVPYTKEYFEDVKTINYKGVYSDIKEINADDYDVFLYTSQTDGLPNILLEISALGLPIVASNIGGISDFIENEKTGILVDIDNIKGYCEEIKNLAKDKQKAEKLVKNAQKKINEQHSWKHFIEKVSSDID